MKKTACCIAAVILAGAAATLAQNGISERSARSLQTKIDAIQAAEKVKDRSGTDTVEVSEPELESYVFYRMKDQIPARVDSIDVQLTAGAVAADAKLTFPPDSTGNPLVDALIGGTHTFFLKGKLAASARRGRFELQEVKVDGIPVPLILVETLVDKYVKPMYPDVDLKEPFPMPWGMDSLAITQGRATIVY